MVMGMGSDHLTLTLTLSLQLTLALTLTDRHEELQQAVVCHHVKHLISKTEQDGIVWNVT